MVAGKFKNGCVNKLSVSRQKDTKTLKPLGFGQKVISERKVVNFPETEKWKIMEKEDESFRGRLEEFRRLSTRQQSPSSRRSASSMS